MRLVSAARRMPKKFYAVRNGRKPGIYETWDACKRQVTGFPGNSFKSFKSRRDAEAFMNTTAAAKTSAERMPRVAASALHFLAGAKPLWAKHAAGGAAYRHLSTTTGSSAVSGSPISIYTDGSCPNNRQVETSSRAAGWGFVVLRREGSNQKVEAELWGNVVCDRESPFFLGAAHGSNNTGELSAIGEALIWLDKYETSGDDATIYYDSEYAAKTATKEWDGPKNRALAECVQRLCEHVRSKRSVHFKHVKGHSNNPFNDRADALANRGNTSTCAVGRYASGLSVDEISVLPEPSDAAKKKRKSRPASAESATSNRKKRSRKTAPREASKPAATKEDHGIILE